MPNPMPATTRPLRATTHDTAELLLVDLATARYAPGDSLDVDTIVREHRVTPGEVHLALFELRRMKVVVRAPFSGAHVVVWHRRFNEVLLRDLVRMISVASTKATSLEDVPEPGVRRPACTAHGLALPADVAHFLDLARAIVQVLSPAARQHVLDDLLLPLEILCSARAVAVHDMRPALGETVRGAIVDLMEAAAHYGEWAQLPGLASDYVTALGVDEPPVRPVD